MNDMTTTIAPLPSIESQVLTPAAREFLQQLAGKFENRRQELLERRLVRQKEIDGGRLPDFLSETAEIRKADWKVAPIPADLTDRRVEITGPVREVCRDGSDLPIRLADLGGLG